MSELRDERLHQGDPARPLVILVHGHGTSRASWISPFDEALQEADGTPAVSFDLVLTDRDGAAPAQRLVEALGRLGYTLPDRTGGLLDRVRLSTPWRVAEPDRFVPLWDRLVAAGYSLLTWSQSQPNGPVIHVLRELDSALTRGRRELDARGLVLVGHSRGGLAIRALLQDAAREAADVRGVIQLASPNKGSRVAVLARRLGRLGRTRLLRFLFGRAVYTPTERPVYEALEASVMHLLRYSTSEAVSELEPGSRLIRSLARGAAGERARAIPLHLLTGDCPTYFRAFLAAADGAGPARHLLDVSGHPSTPLVPDEMRPGRGDGAVALRRARLAHAIADPPFPVNHGEILVDPAVHARVLAILAQLEVSP